jgi:hypothetical protein
MCWTLQHCFQLEVVEWYVITSAIILNNLFFFLARKRIQNVRKLESASQLWTHLFIHSRPISVPTTRHVRIRPAVHIGVRKKLCHDHNFSVLEFLVL